jgi:HSP20 family protein
MTTLVKTNRSNGIPSVRKMMEDFWNTDKFFNQPFFSEALPAVNVKETKDNFHVEVAAPGYKKDDFHVTAENGILTISAENRHESKEEKDSYTRQEFSCSSFSRSFTLPDNTSSEDIKAHYEDGLLNIELKKLENGVPAKKEIKIN